MSATPPEKPTPSGQPTPYDQPTHPSAPAATPAPPAGYVGYYDEPKHRTLSIVGFVLSLLGPLTVVGLVVSVIALVKSRKANEPTGFALAGTIIGAIGTVVVVALTAITIAAVLHLASTCADLGQGTHYVDGVTYTCG
ncbi:hypothetical protein CLV28_2695 [Sediminihabitans luteus]|uniref:DUF4190 domain-containing protein n=1 Tax=Sediminihabitans luteus TaxID=1138585 RepID=A0A2M9CCW4_9CELL|nr:DUF4190 domain-containing protein [Sediminihabitans luteus]PJJ69232.1 hypothetical protein CLV28_2695 [Sediminihabitans luteus]GII98908.1 hypothetical protein Slu03_12860 [Sediminihabitans luteus]